jgi:hypothetical protein
MTDEPTEHDVSHQTPTGPAGCMPHNNPEQYVKGPHPTSTSPTAYRATCKACGCFVGYGDTARDKPAKRAKKEANDARWMPLYD